MLLCRATVDDMRELLRRRGELTLSRARYRALVSQTVLGEAYAVYESVEPEGLLAIAGILPLEPDAGEIWFGVRAGGLGSHLLPVVRLARAVISKRVPDYPSGLFCLVKFGHEPGERLAALIGCVPQDVRFGPSREWTFDHEHGRQLGIHARPAD